MSKHPMHTESVFVKGVEFECTFYVYPATKGYRDKYGAPEEPDEDASIEFESIIVMGAPEFEDVISILHEEIEQAIWDELSE